MIFKNNLFIYWRERGRKQGKRQGGRVPKQTPRVESRCTARCHDPWDGDLSWNQEWGCLIDGATPSALIGIILIVKVFGFFKYIWIFLYLTRPWNSVAAVSPVAMFLAKRLQRLLPSLLLPLNQKCIEVAKPLFFATFPRLPGRSLWMFLDIQCSVYQNF